MFVCICERDSQSNDQNVGILDTEILKKLSEDSSHIKRENAKEWLDAINKINEDWQNGGKNHGHTYGVEYGENPSIYAPDEARVRAFPVQIEFCATIFVGNG